MILLYLASEKNAGALDADCVRCGLLVQTRVGSVNLRRFVVEEGANLSGFSHLALDLCAIEDGEDEIIQAVRGLRAMHELRIIAVTRGANVDTHFLERLEHEGVTQLLTDDGTEEMPTAPLSSNDPEPGPDAAPGPSPKGPNPAPEPPPTESVPTVVSAPPPELDGRVIVSPVQQSATGEKLHSAETGVAATSKPTDDIRERFWQYAETRVSQMGDAPPSRQDYTPLPPSPQTPVPTPNQPSPTRGPGLSRPISIGICGAVHRAGVTTQASNLAAFLARSGDPVSVLEANTHGHIGRLAPFFGAKPDKYTGAIRMEGVDFFTRYDAALAGNYSATIFDYGMFEEMDAHSFFTRDVKIICACAKPWEAHTLQDIFPLCGGRGDVLFLFSFVPENERSRIKRQMGPYAPNTFFSAYMPSLFDPSPNEAVYAAIIGTRFFWRKSCAKRL